MAKPTSGSRERERRPAAEGARRRCDYPTCERGRALVHDPAGGWVEGECKLCKGTGWLS